MGHELLSARSVVLVEGTSDRIALETLARLRERNLESKGVAVVAVGGAHAMGRYLARFGPGGLDARLAGLCDAGEERHVRVALERAGLGTALDRAGMEALGFFVCEADLEDELIRALGTGVVEAVIASEGDLGAFRTLQKQPAWRGRPLAEQLRRFMGSGGSRKVRYARLFVEALDASRVPAPLDGVLEHVAGPGLAEAEARAGKPR